MRRCLFSVVLVVAWCGFGGGSSATSDDDGAAKVDALAEVAETQPPREEATTNGKKTTTTEAAPQEGDEGAPPEKPPPTKKTKKKKKKNERTDVEKAKENDEPSTRVPAAAEKEATQRAHEEEEEARFWAARLRKRQKDDSQKEQNFSSAVFNWTAAQHRVRHVLATSTAAYAERDAERALRSALRSRDRAVWVVDGKIYVDRAFLGQMKHELHLRFLRSVLANARRVAEVTTNDAQMKRAAAFASKRGTLVYKYESMASGPDDCDADLPTLVIAKKYGLEQCGVMIPNPYFDDLQMTWKPDFDRLLALGLKKTWDQRNPRVFWRGKVRQEDKCGRDAGNVARVSASALTLLHAASFDVRPVDCETRRRISKECDAQYAVRDVERRAQASRCKAVKGQFVTHGRFADYRFLLDLPGSTSGSYSRNLNHLWLLGGVVLIWTGPLLQDAGAAQWYTPALEDGHTHVVVDRDTAQNAVAGISNDANERARLVDNARGVAERFLCPDCIVRYFLALVRDLAAHDTGLYRLLNDDAATNRRKAILRDARCDKLHLVQVVGHHPTSGGRKAHTTWKVATRPVDSTAVCQLLAKGGGVGPNQHGGWSTDDTTSSRDDPGGGHKKKHANGKNATPVVVVPPQPSEEETATEAETTTTTTTTATTTTTKEEKKKKKKSSKTKTTTTTPAPAPDGGEDEKGTNHDRQRRWRRFFRL